MVTSHSNRPIRRRSVLKAIGASAFVGTGIGSVAADSSTEHYHNPLYEPVFPDPTVIEADGTYYAYGSHQQMDTESQEHLIPILSSNNLIDWTYENDALQALPDWRTDDASVWAPDITYYDGEYRIYYSYSVWGSNENPGIGLATASTPTGPFTDQGPVFRESDIGVTNCIDAEFHLEGDTPYMLWGSWYGIHGVELTPDGREYVDGTTFHLAGDRREGAHLVQENGYYYLYYSTGHCCEAHNSDYTVEVGRATSLTGPYVNQNGTDLRTLNEHNSGVAILSGNDRFVAPGHNTTILDSNGQRWMLYHAYDTQHPGTVNGTWRRSLMVDRIEYDANDWPVVACDGRPSEQAPVPGRSSNCADGPISDGTYHITNVNSGKLLEVGNADTSDGANVRQWADTAHATQDWTLVTNGDGTYRLENDNSGKVLAVDGGGTANGANVVQWPWNGADSQRWFVEATSSGYRIENENSGKALDVYEQSTADGANVVQWDYWGGENQQWTLNPVE